MSQLRTPTREGVLAAAQSIAAILPLPKKREAVSPSGFTRRYGNTIRARIGPCVA